MQTRFKVRGEDLKVFSWTWRKAKELLRAGVSSRKAKEGPLAKNDNKGRKRSARREWTEGQGLSGKGD